MSGFKNILFKLADPLNIFKLQGGDTPPAPAAPPPTPTRDDPAVLAAQQEEAARNRRLRGRGATLLYGAGETDPTSVSGGKSGATLLGQ